MSGFDLDVRVTYCGEHDKHFAAGEHCPICYHAAKADAGKPRWDLLPLRAIAGIVDVLTFGVRKYAPESWRLVPNAKDRYFAAAMRHLIAWRLGEDFDPESKLHHLDHAGCNVAFLRELEADK